ncbi:PIN-like domain-containing protein [Corallococcus sp. AB045]|uniref:PIN-like domain-containing protein n=1 Tax=Corallococcus sp. AB045 TaxID=2316719 RepID=UPI0011C3E1B9|nr:PIN-like domain-containing protein [Corallococcus sp. AB045]
MKKAFPEYFARDAKDNLLWTQALIVFDASALLDTYTFSETTRLTLLDFLKRLEKQLWMPHQFAQEFLRNRRSVIHKQVNRYKSISKAFSEFRKPVAQYDNDISADHFLRTHLANPLKNFYDAAEKELKEHLKALESMANVDPWLEQLSELIDTRAGDAPTMADYRRMVEDAKFRFSLNIPPGWRDQAKEAQGLLAYGDYFGWSQILEHAKKKECPTILVIDDSKDDWWEKDPATKKLRGARPELIAEYRTVVGQNFFTLRIESFIFLAGEILGKPVADPVKEELRAHEAATSPDRDVKITAAKALGTEQPKVRRGEEKLSGVSESKSPDSDRNMKLTPGEGD